MREIATFEESRDGNSEKLLQNDPTNLYYM